MALACQFEILSLFHINMQTTNTVITSLTILSKSGTSDINTAKFIMIPKLRSLSHFKKKKRKKERKKRKREKGEGDKKRKNN